MALLVHLRRIMQSKSVKQTRNASILQRLFRYVMPYRWVFAASLLLCIILAILTPVRPYLIQVTMNTAGGKTGHLPFWLQWLPANSLLQFVVQITLFQVGFVLFETVLRFIFLYTTAWLGQAVVKDLRMAVYQKVLGLPLQHFDTTPIGTLTTRTINDIESINEVFSDGLIPIIADLLSIALTLATMFYMNWQLTLVSLIPLPILLVATYYFKESVNKSFIKVRNAVAALNAFVQEHITGMSLVQAFAAEKREFGKFDTINQQHRNANIKAIFAYSVFFPVVEVVLAVSMGLQVWWIAGQQLEAGLLVSFILYINLIFRPLRVIADKFNVLQMGIIASERVFAVLDTASEPSKETNITIPHWPQGAAISFNKVQFSYQPGVPVLKNIEFSVEPGTTVALVGHTGSGKTSIISVLNKFYPIQAGEVTINGVNIEQVSTASLRQNIGVVLQDVFLFSGTLLENITLRNPTITEQQVVDAAKLLQVHDFIMQLHGGYQFNVMERGNTLSVGQRQIISFMRALLYNPYILVLDEATSSIDTESEQLIQNAIDTLIANRTSIVVAHRLSTIKKAHKILVLDKGELVEEGTHEQLLEQKGHYYQLYAMQTQNSPTG